MDEDAMSEVKYHRVLMRLSSWRYGTSEKCTVDAMVGPQPLWEWFAGEWCAYEVWPDSMWRQLRQHVPKENNSAVKCE